MTEEITLEMIEAGVAAYKEASAWKPELFVNNEDKCLVIAIYTAMRKAHDRRD